MWRLDKEEEETIQYGIAIFMIVFGAVLAVMGFWVPPVGELSTSLIGLLGEILIFVGAIFHLNINFRNKESAFETKINNRLKEMEERLK